MENLTNWCVYMHENRVNGKKYIGITSQKPTRRWQNGRHYENCAVFFRAIQKYGWDGFRHEILYTDLTQAEAERLEVDLIEKYGTRDPEKGYNLAVGGSARAGWHHTEEARTRMSSARKGHAVAAETRERIRESNFGHPVSAETRAKMSAAKIGNPGRIPTEEELKRRSEHRPAELQAAWKPVQQFTPSGVAIKEYPSRKAAAKETGISKSGISACCRGQRKTAGGYCWRYAEAVVGV